MNRKLLIKIFSVVSFVSLILLLIFTFLLVLNALGVEIYTHKSWEWQIGYANYDDVTLKIALFTIFGLSLATLLCTWTVAIMLLLFFEKKAFSAIEQKWIMFCFPLFVFIWLLKKSPKNTTANYESPEDLSRKIKDNLIYGIISPEEFEKQYVEMLNKSKIEH